MEARLTKLRIVGLQYDKGQIHTGDLCLDFTIPHHTGIHIPANVLYILRNGGGKGVFLQSLFQPLDPLSNWSKDANKVSHFFFNERNKPVQYTIHIVEEWEVSPHKRLMIGFSVAPKISTVNYHIVPGRFAQIISAYTTRPCGYFLHITPDFHSVSDSFAHYFSTLLMKKEPFAGFDPS